MIYLYAIFLNIIFGISIVTLLVNLPNRKSSIVFVLSLGILIGTIGLGAIYGAIAFFFPIIYNNRILIDTLITLCVFILAWRKGSFERIIGKIHFRKKIDVLNLIMFFYGIFWCCIIVGELYMEPDGGFDSWMMWNLKARALAASGGDISVTLLNGYQNSDYPLLLPYINARAFQSFGAYSTIIPRITMLLFYIAFMGVFISFVALLKGRLVACFVMGIMFSIPYPRKIFISQYADGPIFTLFMALFAVIWLNEIFNKAEPGKEYYHISFILPGILLGALILMKNEGILLAGSFFCVYILFHFIEKRTSIISKVVLQMALGSLLFIMLFFSARIYYPTENAFISTNILEKFQGFIDISRYKTIAVYLFKEIFSDHWLFIPVLLSFVPFVLGFISCWKKATIIMLFPIVISFIGYMAIYLIISDNLQWYLRFTIDRVISHLVPAYLLYLIIITRVPLRYQDRNLENYNFQGSILQ
ncbi:putative membrane protein [Treponema primitia ZAS-2]|uniref:Putative membrane protein n=1 Tax=Treponema primitia (strain ATCC BAA-887 / DSM 12427 / ZAS-2) TaxID=545694 RepID=F5YNZ0_TREPZ|nr:hypothetical protein [Treponema primitia]AEF84535.1 putative membrane protein [Treponema primitia ZAS-2]